VDGKEVAFTVNKAVPPAAQQAMKAPMRAAGHPGFTVNADPAIEDKPDGPDEVDGLPTQPDDDESLVTPLNAIERSWRDLRRHHLAHHTFKDAADLTRAIHAAVKQLNKERQTPHPRERLNKAA